MRCGSLSYTNGACTGEHGELMLWGGRSWGGGIAAHAQRVKGKMVSRLQWKGLTGAYVCHDLVLGHEHGFILARKMIQKQQT